MGYPTDVDVYRSVRIEKIDEETPTIKTFTFKDKRCNNAQAGQYVMLWIQGVDEIPLSLSAINHRGFSTVTVDRVGEATEAIHLKEVGDFVSIRGPYGRAFRLVKGRVLVVGGGVGMAPLLPLLAGLAELRSEVTLVVGARAEREIVCLSQARTITKSVKGKLIVTTNDGSYGIKGLATDPLEDLFAGGRFDIVYTCGPESMMRRVFELAEEKGVDVQACLERVIRCSVGLCGSCVAGGFRVCREGPVFSSEQLRQILDEFGRFKRNFDGSRTSF